LTPPLPSFARRLVLAWHVLRGRPLIFRAVLHGDIGGWWLCESDQARGTVATANVVGQPLKAQQKVVRAQGSACAAGWPTPQDIARAGT